MSSEQAQSFHSITIGDKNTWDDWHLVPTSRPLVNPPAVKTHYVTVPGRDGTLDLTETLAGRAVYGNRSGSWEFLAINTGQIGQSFNLSKMKRQHLLQYTFTNYGEWYNRYATIMQYLQGKEFDIILDDDAHYFYHGRAAVNSWKSSSGNSIITISYNVEPYKKRLDDTNEKWLWDPFNFRTDVIRSYKNLRVNGTTTITYVMNLTTSTHPLIICSAGGMTVQFNGTTYNLNRGQNEMTQITFTQGDNVLVFTGSGRVTIQSTGGML